MWNRGFTLLEILITISIFSIGILALAKMQVLSIQGSSYNKSATNATVLAQRVIENYRNGTFGTTPTLCGTTQDNLTITCTVTTVGTTPDRYEDVTVNVSWDNNAKKVELYTLVSER